MIGVCMDTQDVTWAHWQTPLLITFMILTTTVKCTTNKDVSSQDTQIEETCYNFSCMANTDANCLTHPIASTLHLSKCATNGLIELLDINFVRPDVMGDICSSEPSCPESSCCCYSYKRNCTVSVKNTITFDNALLSCSNQPECYIRVHPPLLALENIPGFSKYCPVLAKEHCISGGARSSSCWARILQVKYVCHYVLASNGSITFIIHHQKNCDA